MIDFLKTFLRHQNDKMKTPFFSAFIAAALFFYWDVLYYIFNSEQDVLVKIETAKAMSDSKSVFFLLVMVSGLLVVPIFINFVIQILTDGLDNKRKTNLLTNEKKQGQLLYDTAMNKARAEQAPQIIQEETKYKIESVLKKNAELEKHTATQQEVIEHQSMEELEVINANLDIELNELDKYKSEYAILDNHVKELRSENATLKEFIEEVRPLIGISENESNAELKNLNSDSLSAQRYMTENLMPKYMNKDFSQSMVRKYGDENLGIFDNNGNYPLATEQEKIKPIVDQLTKIKLATDGLSKVKPTVEQLTNIKLATDGLSKVKPTLDQLTRIKLATDGR